MRILRFLHSADETVPEGHKSLRVIVSTFPLLKLSLLRLWVVHKEPVLYHKESTTEEAGVDSV